MQKSSVIRTHGFTLVEMSIVLIVISLIVAGIITGKDLVHASKVKSVVLDFNKYRSAINMFMDKYDAYPGDLRNAYDYWPTTLCTNTIVTPGNWNGCNGNGDGMVDWNNESMRTWQHLNFSGMVPGNYTGVHTGGQSDPGVNIPESKFEGGGFWFYYNNPKGHNITFASEAGGSSLSGAIISPPDANSIDKKIDDGHATKGRVQSHNGAGTPGCRNYSGNYDYILSTGAATVCMMQLILE